MVTEAKGRGKETSNEGWESESSGSRGRVGGKSTHFYEVQANQDHSPITSWLQQRSRERASLEPEYYNPTVPHSNHPPDIDRPNRRRSIATFSSTSDSRSQGSMVIGSPAFWDAVTKQEAPSVPPKPPPPAHTTDTGQIYADPSGFLKPPSIKTKHG